MSDDWQKLGDIVKGIVARTEGVMRDRPPVADQDAALFVLMLREIYGPQRADSEPPRNPDQVGGEAK